jgi:hypothetical protein
MQSLRTKKIFITQRGRQSISGNLLQRKPRSESERTILNILNTIGPQTTKDLITNAIQPILTGFSGREPEFIELTKEEVLSALNSLFQKGQIDII